MTRNEERLLDLCVLLHAHIENPVLKDYAKEKLEQIEESLNEPESVTT